MTDKTTNKTTAEKNTDKVADKEVPVTEPVYVRDYRKKVFNVDTNEVFELDEETAEVFATNPKFYDSVWDPNQSKSVSVKVLRWEGADGQQVGS